MELLSLPQNARVAAVPALSHGGCQPCHTSEGLGEPPRPCTLTEHSEKSQREPGRSRRGAGNGNGEREQLREDTEQTKFHKAPLEGGGKPILTPGTRCCGVFGAGEHKDIYRDENIQDSQAGKSL